MSQEPQRIIFALPENVGITDVIFSILKNNGLEETEEEAANKDGEGESESRLMIIRNAAIALFQKKVPEEKLAEVMEKHLETPLENVQKIIGEIKQKLLPYAKIYKAPEKKQGPPEPTTQEVLLEKIKQGNPNQTTIVPAPPKPPPESIKRVDIADVDESAKRLKEQREATAHPGTTSGELQRKGQPDKYREPTE